MPYMDIQTNNTSPEALARAWKRQESTRTWTILLAVAALLSVLPYWVTEVAAAPPQVSFFPSTQLLVFSGVVIALIIGIVASWRNRICASKRIRHNLELDVIRSDKGYDYYRVTSPDGKWHMIDRPTFQALYSSPLARCDGRVWGTRDKLERCSYTDEAYGIVVTLVCEYYMTVTHGLIDRWLKDLDAYREELKAILPGDDALHSKLPLSLHYLMQVGCHTFLEQNQGFLFADTSTIAKGELPNLEAGCQRVREYLLSLCERGVIYNFAGVVEVEYPKIGQSRCYSINLAHPAPSPKEDDKSV